MAKKKYYAFYARGRRYTLNEKGEFGVDGVFSKTWKLSGISSRWNSRPIMWEDVKKKLDKNIKVQGYVYDIDHGTQRFWGGLWLGKLPKAELWRIN